MRTLGFLGTSGNIAISKIFESQHNRCGNLKTHRAVDKLDMSFHLTWSCVLLILVKTMKISSRNFHKNSVYFLHKSIRLVPSFVFLHRLGLLPELMVQLTITFLISNAADAFQIRIQKRGRMTCVQIRRT
jgi:hypothetical protein